VIYVRNMLVGLESVPADVLEAADASGFRSRERLLRVELPLATPLIVSGLRLACVSTIGLVTITSTIGDAFGGLGFFIKERPFFATEVLVGALGSIALALAADAGFARLQRRLTPWARAQSGAAEPSEPARAGLGLAHRPRPLDRARAAFRRASRSTS
jgi:osmoprotectant transport system permease protein